MTSETTVVRDGSESHHSDSEPKAIPDGNWYEAAQIHKQQEIPAASSETNTELGQPIAVYDVTQDEGVAQPMIADDEAVE